MKINKNIAAVILLVVIISGFLFYWYEYRPSKIRKECSDKYLNYYESAGRIGGIGRLALSSGEEAYTKCLAEKGLKK